jgi:hypothetical protein
MAKVTILGREIEVAPYMIEDMELAAPFIDTINETSGAMTGMTGLTKVAGDLCAVLSIGLLKVDPTLTPDFLKSHLGLGDLVVMRDGFTAVMKVSGMQQSGEATAPVSALQEAAGASETPSGKSSTT